MEKNFDVLIVGGGVAGMSAAVYAKRRGKNVAIIEKYALGGQVLTIDKIQNFPSQSLISGADLSAQFVKQVENLDVTILFDDVLSIDFESKKVHGRLGEYSAKKLIIATGLSYIPLGLDEDRFLGRGVSFCAVCDGNFFKGKDVCVASDKGSGIKAAIYLSNLCKSVTLIDNDILPVKHEKINIISGAQVTKLVGKDQLEAIEIECGKKHKTIKTSGLFIELGKRPNKQLFKGLKLDSLGFVVTDENMRTSVAGVWAVGDVRSKKLRQIVTACSDGAIAACDD